MAGRFSSEAQAKADPEYRDIRLVMAPIWKDRADGPWLYVEQAVAATLGAPYRQRIYQLARREDGAYVSRVFTLPDPGKAVGAFDAKVPLADLTPDRLTLRDGCAVVLRPRGDAFVGGTEGKGCASDLRGASYATSEVEIRADGMTSWDRGFDAGGKQVWGAEKGGYRF